MCEVAKDEVLDLDVSSALRTKWDCDRGTLVVPLKMALCGGVEAQTGDDIWTSVSNSSLKAAILLSRVCSTLTILPSM